MTHNVWIDLDDIPSGSAARKAAGDLLNELNIHTDYWDRIATHVSGEQLARLRQFELEHSDKPEEYDAIYASGSNPYSCNIVQELDDEQFASCHVTSVRIGKYSEDSWQR